MIRNDYLHMSSRFRRIRVPLKVKLAASSRTPASHRPGVCVHMHTQVCTHTCIYHSKINEKEKKRKEKGKEDNANSLCQAPRPISVGAFGSGLAVPAAKPSGLQDTLPLLPRLRLLATVAGELALAGRYGAVAGQGSSTQTQIHTRWLPARASEEVGKRGSVGGRRGEVPRELLACKDFLRPQQKNCSRSLACWLPAPELSITMRAGASYSAVQVSTKQAAEPTDQIGAIYSVHSPVKCSNKNLWTSASCYKFFSFGGGVSNVP